MGELKDIIPFVPLLQTIAWILLITILVIVFYGQIKFLIKKVGERVEKGSRMRVGPFELGEDLRTLQPVQGQQYDDLGLEHVGLDSFIPAEEALELIKTGWNRPIDEDENHEAENHEDEGMADWSAIMDKDENHENEALSLDQKDEDDRINNLNNERKQIYERNRGVFLTHLIRPSEKKGQRYDVFIYLIRPGQNDFSDVKHADFFFGPYWGNRTFRRSEKNGQIGLVTSAYGTFFCICSVVFKDEHQILLSRYIDFEMSRVFDPNA